MEEDLIIILIGHQALTLLNNSLVRVIEGISLYSQYPGAKLIFTGGCGNNLMSNAEVAAKVALSLGVPETAIITFTKSRDTQEETFEVEKIAGRQPFLLVTSANHMTRAERFFLARNMHPITAPANQPAITSPLHPWENISLLFTFFLIQNALDMNLLAQYGNQ